MRCNCGRELPKGRNNLEVSGGYLSSAQAERRGGALRQSGEALMRNTGPSTSDPGIQDGKRGSASIASKRPLGRFLYHVRFRLCAKFAPNPLTVRLPP